MAICLGLLQTSGASAAPQTWTGATDGLWNTAGNWNGLALPGLSGPTSNVSVNTDIATFDNAVNPAISYAATDRNLGGLNFTGASTGAFVFSSTNSSRLYFTLGGAVTMDAAVVNAQTLARIGFTGTTGSYTMENNAAPATAVLATNTVVNHSTGTAELILTGTNAGRNVLGAISQTNTGVLSLTKNGTGTWQLGNNTFTGGVTLNDGILGLASMNALGTGTFTVNGGTFGSAGATSRVINNNIVVGGDFTMDGVLAELGITLAGTMNLGGSVRTVSLGNSATISGVISNGGLDLAYTTGGSARTLTLTGSNTYAGPTSVSGDTLYVNGALLNSSAVSVAATGTLGGTGDIANSVLVSTGGFLQPGTTTGLVGTLNTGMLTLQGNYVATITGSSTNDRVNVTGNADFTGGTLTPTLSGGYAPLAGDFFDVADWTGSFLGAPAFNFASAVLDPGLEWDTSTFASDGRLRVAAVPEPAAALLGGLGLLTLFRRRRRP